MGLSAIVRHTPRLIQVQAYHFWLISTLKLGPPAVMGVISPFITGRGPTLYQKRHIQKESPFPRPIILGTHPSHFYGVVLFRYTPVNQHSHGNIHHFDGIYREGMGFLWAVLVSGRVGGRTTNSKTITSSEAISPSNVDHV